VNLLLTNLYRELLKIAVNQTFPTHEKEIKTRMKSLHPEGCFKARVIDENTQAVCVNLARAGTLPSQVCYDALTYFLKPQGVRQDHIAINRKTNAQDEVIGTHLGSTKIGGSIDGKFLVLPDPMGATGSTIDSAMEIYQPYGKPKLAIAIHLIVTPEYLKHVTARHPGLAIFAIRLDRGLSPKEVLQTVPGVHWDKERGLNEKQYIVPGAGGLGEVINNAYV
jgi:uracil phosphoribosyltransferase